LPVVAVEQVLDIEAKRDGTVARLSSFLDLDPEGDVARVVFSQVGRESQTGTEVGRSQLGGMSSYVVAFISPPLAAKIAVEEV
jgi:hypothetical protein